jgi:predicted ATPase/class 3 adenylate cyclase
VPGEPPNVPSGTVTFLFSDVVGSTRLWAADPEAMSAALRVHDQIFIDTIATYGGHVFSTAGDSFAAAFDRASEALECAEAIQTALSDVDWGRQPALSVRIGLHMGEAEERDANYFGPTVNRAARVAAVAHGGQTVLTDAVRDASGTEVTDLGTYMLRDIEAPVHLSQLGDREFPALWSAGSGIVSLPSPRTSLVGRDDAVEHVRKLVAAHRLVTLTGVGGCGKTRLAIEVAYREIPAHPQGVWFVDLSTISDEGALPGAFVTALGLTTDAATDPMEQVASYLAPRTALLVIDNCEHVIDVVADAVDRLLDSAPDLRIVTTSREALEVDGEFTWNVPSLATGRNAPAVQLFFVRAEAAGSQLPDDAKTTEAVCHVVEHLDGIPLAIELAAARMRTMSVSEVRDLLDDRFALLSGGSRRARQRQATLEGAVQWSYDLLSEDEQALLRTLSVFQGGFAAPDVAVVAKESELNARRMIDALAAKSLVDVTRGPSGEVRHRLLETIRLFASHKLVDAGEAVDTRNRHLEHFAGDATMTLQHWSDLGRLTRFGLEYENFRTAIAWALERGQIDQAVRMAAMGTEPAAARGEIQLAVDILRRPVSLPPEEDALVKSILGWALASQGDFGALSAVDEARAIGEVAPGDFLIFTLDVTAAIHATLGDIRAAGVLYERACGLAVQSGNPLLQAGANVYLMADLCQRLRFDECLELGDQSIAIAPEYAWRHVIEAYRVWALLRCGRIDEAVAGINSFAPIPSGSQWAHLNPIFAHTVLGHSTDPATAARSLTATMREPVSRRPVIRSDTLQGFAYLALLRGDDERCREIVANSTPFGAGPIFSWLRLAPADVTRADAVDHLVRLVETDPPLERFARSAQHGQRLIDEEFDRWS